MKTVRCFSSPEKQRASKPHRAGYAAIHTAFLITGMVGVVSGLGSAALPEPLQSVDDRGLDTFRVGITGETNEPDVRGLLDRYCVRCHNEIRLTAGLSLDALDASNPAADPETWEKVIRRLRTGTMPPGGIPRPEPQRYDGVAEWLESELDSAWGANPKPGRIAAVHRLNRTEYSNAINELLGLDVDWTSQLPGDPTSDGGFDNVADALTISPIHVRRYLSVARKATRLAIGLPSSTPRQENYSVSDAKPQEDRMGEDLPFGSRGGLAVRHHFPVGGEYVISVPRFRTNYHGYVDGMGWPQELAIALDGEVLERFIVGGGARQYRPGPHSYEGAPEGPGWEASPKWEEYMQGGATGSLEVRVHVDPGPHVVSTYFSRDFQVEEGLLPQPPHQVRGQIDAQSNERMGFAGAQAIQIDGPYESAGIAKETPSRREIFTCEPDMEAEEEQCATEILSRMAERAYRRPVSDDDVQTLLRFFRLGREDGGSFDHGIQFGVERVLVDPDLILRTYRDPPARSGREQRSNVLLATQRNELPAYGGISYYPLSDLEVASRLAFFLWRSLPDDTLLALAKEERLTNPSILREQVRRMLADSRADKALVRDFAAQWLNLPLLDNRTLHQEIYIHYDENLRDAMRKETELFVESTLREDRSVLELLSADYTYLNERLARHYKIPNIYGSHFRRVTLPDLEERGGLLGHASLLTLTSYPNRTSPVLRGKWLLENIIGFSVPPPPPDVDTNLNEEGEEDGVGARTIRDLLAEHRKNAVCASCHSVMDPLGLALEGYDATGGRRIRDERGNLLREDGALPGGIEIDGMSGLRAMVLERRSGAAFATTVTEKLMAYALGRDLEYYDQPVLRRIVRDAEAADYRWSSLIMGIVESPSFLMRERVAE